MKGEFHFNSISMAFFHIETVLRQELCMLIRVLKDSVLKLYYIYEDFMDLLSH